MGFFSNKNQAASQKNLSIHSELSVLMNSRNMFEKILESFRIYDQIEAKLFFDFAVCKLARDSGFAMSTISQFLVHCDNLSFGSDPSSPKKEYSERRLVRFIEYEHALRPNEQLSALSWFSEVRTNIFGVESLNDLLTSMAFIELLVNAIRHAGPLLVMSLSLLPDADGAPLEEVSMSWQEFANSLKSKMGY
jgi:hypothetical protein